MDGVHDLGGMEGFGPVEAERDEPPFHEAWEGRVHGMMMALAAQGKVRNFRHSIERMDPVHYLSSPYYEHWLDALPRLLVEGGHVTAAEVAGAHGPPASRTDPELTALVRSLLQPFPVSGRDAGHDATDAAFRPGEAVRVRRTITARHTRCPRYVRGQRGTVSRVHPPSPLHDASVEGERRAEPYYSVTFDSRELWDHEGEPWEVVVDLWESYLEAAR